MYCTLCGSSVDDANVGYRRAQWLARVPQKSVRFTHKSVVIPTVFKPPMVDPFLEILKLFWISPTSTLKPKGRSGSKGRQMTRPPVNGIRRTHRCLNVAAVCNRRPWLSLGKGKSQAANANALDRIDRSWTFEWYVQRKCLDPFAQP